MGLENLLLEWDRFKTGYDVYLHSGLSVGMYWALVEKGGDGFKRTAAYSALTVAGIGIIKELYDLSSYGLFSFQDVSYDICGIGAGVCIHYLLSRKRTEAVPLANPK